MKGSSSAFPVALRAFGLGLAAWVALTLPLAGRIGERQSQIEDRLFADGVGQRLQPADVAALSGSPRGGFRPGSGSSGGRSAGAPPARARGFSVTAIDSLLWQALGETLPAPDSNGIRKRPPEFPEYIYFKTDDGTPAAQKLKEIGSPKGWEFRVYLYKQLSGLEVYHRMGASLSDSEIDALLLLNRGDSAWSHKSVPAAEDVSPGDDLDKLSFIGYDYQRNDGQVRAIQVGNDFVIFSADLDRNLLELKAAQSKPKTATDPAPAAPAATHTPVYPPIIHGF